VYDFMDFIMTTGCDRKSRHPQRFAVVLCGLVVAACGSAPSGSPPASSVPPTTPPTTGVAAPTAPTTTVAAAEPLDETCAHVVDVAVEPEGERVYRFTVTVRSDDRGWDKYADAWEVRTRAGEVLGVRELTHPHDTEQPFTRSLSGVSIPAGVDEVEVLARDSVVGFCGRTQTVSLSG
jgi:hypothetical protein